MRHLTRLSMPRTTVTTTSDATDDAPTPPLVTFAELVANANVVATSYEIVGYNACVTFEHPNGHQYRVMAWDDGCNTDVEADGGTVDLDAACDADDADAIGTVESVAYMRTSHSRLRRFANDLLSAASAMLDAGADDHAAEQAHEADDRRCTFCALHTVIDQITTIPQGRITDADRY